MIRLRHAGRFARTFAVFLATFAVAQAQTPSLATIAGATPDGASTNQMLLFFPEGVTGDKAGNTYIADTSNNIVRKITPAGVASIFAGTGRAGSAGDGGPAAQAQLNAPGGLAVDGAGNLYIADRGNHRIRKIDTVGAISTFAGTGADRYGGDGLAAVDAHIRSPRSLAFDTKGRLYIADTDNHRVRRISLTGVISTVAGNGLAGFDVGPGLATSIRLNSPQGVAVDADGNIYIGDTNNHRICRVDTNGRLTTYAGRNQSVTTSTTTAAGAVTTATTLLPIAAFDGDGRNAAFASVNAPTAMVVDAAGHLYFMDTNNSRLRKIDPDGIISTVRANLAAGRGVGLSAAGEILFSATNTHLIYRMDPATGGVGLAAGRLRLSPDGPAAGMILSAPRGVAAGPDGSVYFTEFNNGLVRRISPTGEAVTVAGGGTLLVPGILPGQLEGGNVIPEGTPAPAPPDTQATRWAFVPPPAAC